MNRLLKFIFYIFINMGLLMRVNFLPAMDESPQTQNLEYFSKLTTDYTQGYLRELEIFELADQLKNKFKTKIFEIDDEYEDILTLKLNVFGFQDLPNLDLETTQKLNSKLEELCAEREKIRNFIEQQLMEKLTPPQQAAVIDYIKKRNDFFEISSAWRRMKFSEHIGGIPFFELDPTIFVPFDQIKDDRPNVCIYLNELKLNGTAPSCMIERAAQAGCPEAIKLFKLQFKDDEQNFIEPEETPDQGVVLDVDLISSEMSKLSLAGKEISTTPDNCDVEMQDACSQNTQDTYTYVKRERKLTAPDFHQAGYYKQALALIKQSQNQDLISWYSAFCSLQGCQQRDDQIKGTLKKLVLLITLIPEKTIPNIRNFLGFAEVIKILKKLQNNSCAKTLLMRLGLKIGFGTIDLNKTTFVKEFIYQMSDSSDASVLHMLGYIYDNGIWGKPDPLTAVNYFIRALESGQLTPNERDEAIYFLSRKGQALFDVVFQSMPHTCGSFPKNDNKTKSEILACYALVLTLKPSDTLKAASMFMAAEGAVAFLCENQPEHELTCLEVGVNALNFLHQCVEQKGDLYALAAIMFSFSRRYMSEICYREVIGNLAAISELFLQKATQFLAQSKHPNKQRNLLMGLACNAYCIIGNKIDVNRNILIDLMRGVAKICQEQYWFFRYNLESLIAGYQNPSMEKLRPFVENLCAARGDGLISAMIISDVKKSGSWCSIS